MDTDGDGVGDNGDAFPNDDSETLDTDGDGVGNNAQAIAEAAAAKQKEEDEKRRNIIIISVIGVIVIGLAVGLFLRRRGSGDSDTVKDYNQVPGNSVEQIQPVVSSNELQIINQWTDDSGYTWRKMSDETFHYWDGNQWIKHS